MSKTSDSADAILVAPFKDREKEGTPTDELNLDRQGRLRVRSQANHDLNVASDTSQTRFGALDGGSWVELQPNTSSGLLPSREEDKPLTGCGAA